ncbi:hypothetical protein [Sulfurimonas sp.]|uniref:hypothetical protein n=1 Tax=Sulfurimonas sp. TaxID=2022749 RepID=UPI002604CF48|nr:hypothetical protein [Sulfurimonas sp.]MDD3854092.1 hypothetical protein [Sulfurimonas sp.]
MIELIKANTKFFFITWGIVLLVNQIFIFGGCLAPYCIVAALPHTGVISAVIVYLYFQEEKKEKIIQQERSYESQYTSNNNKADPLKEMGDAYEKEIGKEFESKGDFVIYNGLIRGVADGGVDLIVISPDSQSINLVQCKNWHKMKMEHHHINSVYDKLTDYASNINIAGFLGIYLFKYPVALQEHLHYKKERDEIANILKASKNYTNIRKTLYIATEQVIDIDVGQHLTMIKPNIFRYKDMKIAITKI